MIVIVDVVLDDGDADRPEVGTPVRIDLLDTSQVDADAVVLASTMSTVQGTAGSWLTTAELVGADVDPRADVTVWARVAGSGATETAAGDWITMQHVPVSPTSGEQRVTAPVRRVG